MDLIRVDVNNLRFEGNKMRGDLAFLPYHLFVDDYLFRDGDVVVDDGVEIYIDMTEDKFFELAYES